jgi:Protein of unknown function (DUF742)
MTTAPDHGEAVASPFVRPYTLTNGRTRSRGEELLPIEALVVSKAAAQLRAAALPPAQRRVVELCGSAISIAEISAALDLPLGVARVIVGDLAADELVQVHMPQTGESDRPDIELLERVLNGLQSL